MSQNLIQHKCHWLRRQYWILGKSLIGILSLQPLVIDQYVFPSRFPDLIIAAEGPIWRGVDHTGRYHIPHSCRNSCLLLSFLFSSSVLSRISMTVRSLGRPRVFLLRMILSRLATLSSYPSNSTRTASERRFSKDLMPCRIDTKSICIPVSSLTTRTLLMFQHDVRILIFHPIRYWKFMIKSRF